MLKVKYEVYHNDYCRHDESANFQDLDEFANWMYANARIWNGRPDVFFVNPDGLKTDDNLDSSCLEFRTTNYDNYWNFCIEDTNKGIIYTTGKYTCGKKHLNKDMREWLKKGRNGELEPKFTFAE